MTTERARSGELAAILRPMRSLLFRTNMFDKSKLGLAQVSIPLGNLNSNFAPNSSTPLRFPRSIALGSWQLHLDFIFFLINWGIRWCSVCTFFIMRRRGSRQFLLFLLAGRPWPRTGHTASFSARRRHAHLIKVRTRLSNHSGSYARKRCFPAISSHKARLVGVAKVGSGNPWRLSRPDVKLGLQAAIVIPWLHPATARGQSVPTPSVCSSW